MSLMISKRINGFNLPNQKLQCIQIKSILHISVSLYFPTRDLFLILTFARSSFFILNYISRARHLLTLTINYSKRFQLMTSQS